MKVNGTIIGQIYAHNEGHIEGYLSDVCKYKWHCYLMDMHGEPTLVKGTTKHRRSNGFAALAELLFKEVQSESGL